MMTNHEVIQAADHVEAAIAVLSKLDKLCGQNMKIHADAADLMIHEREPNSWCEVFINRSLNKMKIFENNESGVSLELYTWLTYKHDSSSPRDTNYILSTRNNKNSVSLCTNTGNDNLSYGRLMGAMPTQLEFHTLGTPECDEYLFLRSLVMDDLTMNALLFHYEWRRRHGRNIILRIGANPVKTCLAIEKAATEAYDKFIEYSSDPENSTSFRTI